MKKQLLKVNPNSKIFQERGYFNLLVMTNKQHSTPPPYISTKSAKRSIALRSNLSNIAGDNISDISGMSGISPHGTSHDPFGICTMCGENIYSQKLVK
jgi:hypothetical protein